MARPLTLLLAGAVLVIPPFAGGVSLRPARPRTEPVPRVEVGSAVGKWKVEFANGVTQACEIRKDGTASVAEPHRSSSGKATFQGKSAVITFADDRVERWTPVGKQFVVEHWFPGSQYPNGNRVLGIAKRVN